jgi:putative ABC transport system permease protein
VANTGIPINVGMLVVIGFLVGTVVSGQTFYSFVLENTRNLGALKAMGTSNLRICGMLLIQSFTVGFIGFGLGMGLAALNGYIAIKTGKLPSLMVWQIPAGVLTAVLFICALAAFLGILRIARVDPASVFR